MVFGFGDKGITIRDAHFPGRPGFDSYGNGGFRFADMSHKGSLLLLPSGIYGWEQGEDDAESIRRPLPRLGQQHHPDEGEGGPDERPAPPAHDGRDGERAEELQGDGQADGSSKQFFLHG